MNVRTKREVRAWGRALGITVLIFVTAGALVLVGLSTIRLGGQ